MGEALGARHEGRFLRYAILGGGNPYALNLARHLLVAGHDVIGIGRSALKGEAFTLGALEAGYRYHVYTVGPDTEFIVELLGDEDVDVIVNFAAQGEGQASFDPKRWRYFYQTNVQWLVEFGRHLHELSLCERFIQVGTSELYGSVSSPASEVSPLKPSSAYANSKMCFDLHVLLAAKTVGFPGIIVRPSNCFCEGQQLHRIIPKALIYAMTGRKLPLHGGGVARKSYLHADDLSRAIMLVAARGEIGEVYNVGPQEPTAIKRLVELCAQCLGMDARELYELMPERQGQDSCYWLDSSKMRSLGWEPEVHLHGGIARVHGWLQRYPELLTMSTDYRIRA